MKLAQLTKILDILPIEDADKIELAKVLDFDVVVQKNTHNVGDTVLFISPDTLIPKKFLDLSCETDEKIRLKTIKMKGKYSAGLIIPLKKIKDIVNLDEINNGEDIGHLIGVEKYEKPISSQLNGEALGNFPTYIVNKTDEENYLSNPDIFSELKEQRFSGKEIVSTIKCDGTSVTFLTDGEIFHVCSRNFILKENETNVYWGIAKKHKIKDIIISSGKNLAIQGEICGPSIQKNPMDLKEIDIFVFLIKDLDNKKWFSWDEIVDFCKKNNLNTVKEIERFSVDELPEKNLLQKKANDLKYDSGKMAEGFVLRTVEPTYSNVLQKSWWSVKVLSQPYDLKN
jgi:RNA ligase (TIGR02306 family)